MARPKVQRDVYQEITDKFIEALESGTVPWIKPWDASGDLSLPHNAVSGRQYRGINLAVAWVTAQSKGYAANGWLTYNQARQLGGHVRLGEKSTLFVAWNIVKKKDPDTGEEKTFPLIKPWYLFNVDQCENLDMTKIKAYDPEAEAKHQVTDVLALGEQVGADIRHGGSEAFFSPTHDFISVPKQTTFKTINDYESTLAHELVHWTGGSKRLKREQKGGFGSEDYAFEELIAEIGSAFVCAQLGIKLEGLQHENYIGSWIKKLQNDKKAIVKAASQAQKASEFLLTGAKESYADIEEAA